jgi:hypothetical protein
MEKLNCPKFDSCSAALCPRDPHPRRYWYADTEICPLRNVPDWVKVQRKIQKLNPDPHRYFTQKMLESITRVARDITGIEYVGYSQTKEYDWIHARENRHRNNN